MEKATNKPMKKYKVKKAYSILDKVLLITNDEIYAELRNGRYFVFSIKTRKLIGVVSQEKFEKNNVVYR